MKAKQLAGQSFGRWLVLNRDYSKNNGRSNWLCQCQCKKKTKKIVDGYSLTSGRSTSCGCIRDELRLQQHLEAISKKPIKKEKIDLVGKTFNYLKVISIAEINKHHTYYNCQCLKCGNKTIVRGSYIISGHTQSCGCLKSKGEQKIIELLKKNNISFIKEKTFETCKYPDTNYLARFDFYVNNEYIIEFDGQQHFNQTNGWNTENNFKKIQYHDKIKNQWCKDHHIPLIRIPYTKFDDLQIDDLLLSTSTFII